MCGLGRFVLFITVRVWCVSAKQALREMYLDQVRTARSMNKHADVLTRKTQEIEKSNEVRHTHTHTNKQKPNVRGDGSYHALFSTPPPPPPHTAGCFDLLACLFFWSVFKLRSETNLPLQSYPLLACYFGSWGCPVLSISPAVPSTRPALIVPTSLYTATR